VEDELDLGLPVVLQHEGDRVRDREQQDRQLQVEPGLPRLLAPLPPTPAEVHGTTLRRGVAHGEVMDGLRDELRLARRDEDASRVMPEGGARPLGGEGAEPRLTEIAITAGYFSLLAHSAP
jgi:hypothetical protein